MIKFITTKIGMNIIADVEERTVDYVIKKPAVVMMQQQNGQLSVGFSPFLELCDEFATGITISKNDVMTVNTPNTELQNQYNKHFGSGIQIATVDMFK
jgi:hypothetical protein